LKSDTKNKTKNKKQAKIKEKHKKTLKKDEKQNKNPFSTELDDLENVDDKKLKKALKKENSHLKNQEILADDRKRPYNSLGRGHAENELTVEEIEAYRIKKLKFDDPMYSMGK
jgi:pre-mRNA-processing factor SLU7